MSNFSTVRVVVLLFFLVGLSFQSASPWGFYAHREINRLAVFTLATDLAGFYKKNQIYVSTHAVDPDKRRYAAPLEGPRHYIDMEYFGDGTVDDLPWEFWEFHDRYTVLHCITKNDSLELDFRADSLFIGDKYSLLEEKDYKSWYQKHIFPNYRYQNEQVEAPMPTEPGVFEECIRFNVYDTMMQHGVLPYHLVDMQRWLTKAFRDGNVKRVLQLSAELGHYIGDATVPLHTTVNYNGQLTGQRGIHAFWESRIPELFAEQDFDVLVGKADYISNKAAFYRDLVRSSHSHLDSVLLIEADLRRTVPEAEQDCYEERLGRIVRVQCASFTKKYYERLDGMVEARFRTAILSVGSAWLTAWVDAGKPNLLSFKEELVVPDTTQVFKAKPGLDGRGH